MRLNHGNLIRQARQALRLTLEELARRAGLSKGFLSQVENGKAGLGLDAAKRLAGVLGLSLEELSAVWGPQAACGEAHPAWLVRLAARYDLHPEAQAALLKVAEESAVYRSAA
ncbi:MAG: helix-turn-helix transcriptional regulator, partial [Kiritimatiellae bacterium]|nr:helix-turn-helix transcriptional regulator [Kiritimatiellia bacterium]